MIKQRVKLLVVAVVLTLVGLGFSGCQKCYECTSLSAAFIFSKAGDTIYSQTATERRTTDTLQYYRSNGYKCDTGFWAYLPNIVDRNPTCAKEVYDRKMFDGDKCEPVK